MKNFAFFALTLLPTPVLAMDFSAMVEKAYEGNTSKHTGIGIALNLGEAVVGLGVAYTPELLALSASFDLAYWNSPSLQHHPNLNHYKEMARQDISFYKHVARFDKTAGTQWDSPKYRSRITRLRVGSVLGHLLFFSGATSMLSRPIISGISGNGYKGLETGILPISSLVQAAVEAE